MAWFKDSFEKLKVGLTKSRETIVNKVTELVSGKAVIEDGDFDRLEELLINSDLGFDLSSKLIESVRIKLRSETDRSVERFIELLKEELVCLLEEDIVEISKNQESPHIYIIVGINGSGKTTTIGKLAHHFTINNKKVIMAAADTFRAAANDQLISWANKSKVAIVSNQSKDPSAVAFECIQKALNDKFDIVLIDTAGRLHNNKNLMIELTKIQRVVSNLAPKSKLEILLVVDGNSGQNALIQAEEFSKYVSITGLIVTKLDGTAKGGSVIQIAYNKKIPIRYVGLGEGLSDLEVFEKENFVKALFAREN